jgi:hypothetical protein
MSRSYKGIYTWETIYVTFFQNSHQPWIIQQDHQELSPANHSIPNKLTKAYIAHHGDQCIWEKLFLQNAYDTKCMRSKIQGCLYIMLHMPCQMQEMHKGNYTYATKELPHTQLKKSNIHQVPLANELKLLDLGVWWKYRLVGHVWVHESKLSSVSLRCLSENGTSLLCAWFWNGALGSLQRLLHWCYHMEVGHGYTPH